MTAAYVCTVLPAVFHFTIFWTVVFDLVFGTLVGIAGCVEADMREATTE